MIDTFKIIKSSCFIQMKVSFSRPMFKFCILVNPILFGWIFYMMYAEGSQRDLVAYVMLGTAIASLWSSISFSSAGDIERERFMGTLEIIFSTPAKFTIIMLGKIIGNTLLGVLSMLISFVFISTAFKVPVMINNPMLFLLSLLLSLASYITVAMLLSACFTLSRNTRALMNSMEYPIFILCGVAFPIEILPIWIRPLSYILSPTYTVKLLRMTMIGINNYNEFYIFFGLLALITIIYGLLARMFYRFIDKRTRIHATLGVY